MLTLLFWFIFWDFPKGGGRLANESLSARPPICSSFDWGAAILLLEGAFNFLSFNFACQLLTKPEGKAGFTLLGALSHKSQVSCMCGSSRMFVIHGVQSLHLWMTGYLHWQCTMANSHLPSADFLWLAWLGGGRCCSWVGGGCLGEVRIVGWWQQLPYLSGWW